MSIVFKKAQTDDVLLIQQLAYTIWHSHYPGIITVEQIEYMLEKMYAAPVIFSEIENGYQWTLIFEDDQPIGFIEYHIEKETQSVKLSKLYILVQYHKKGIGQSALSFAKKQAYMMKAKKLYLTVNKNNTKAIEAYKKAGFSVDKEVCADIGNGYVMDDYIMSYSILGEEFVL
jgi:ribosomal protein S18 acetylase RimI-like enzyme